MKRPHPRSFDDQPSPVRLKAVNAFITAIDAAHPPTLSGAQKKQKLSAVSPRSPQLPVGRGRRVPALPTSQDDHALGH